MKYSIALTLVKGLSAKVLNELTLLNQNEEELFQKITLKYRFNSNQILDKADQIIEDCFKNNI